MERILKKVASSVCGTLLGGSLDERLDKEYIAHQEQVEPNLIKIPTHANDQIHSSENVSRYMHY